MTTARIGLALRLIGPALELVCIGLILWEGRRGRPLLPPPLGWLPYIGVALGLAMVAIGLSLSTPRPSRSRTRDRADELRG
ncbi:hypothetical protein [Tautonia plasticadhaerens]|uniref:Uncharacterized protein n=1 Tax=Tautonia plasticadhaerens TaxID=2527974 RepID=A0A518GYB0_9BACT|nr:hypothetical protein [Tautonia plasticadhaerens]QDV33532.1 hypothetical protein ElP_14050 [Tautonia plasticadhaerens]